MKTKPIRILSYKKMSLTELPQPPKETKYKGLFYLLSKNTPENHEKLYREKAPNSILANIGKLANLDPKLFQFSNNVSNMVPHKDIDRYVGKLILECSPHPSPIVLLTNALTNKDLYRESFISQAKPVEPSLSALKDFEGKPFEEQVEITSRYLLEAFSNETIRIFGKTKGAELLPEYLKRMTLILFIPIPDSLSLNDLSQPNNWIGANYQELFPDLYQIPLKEIKNKKNERYQNLKRKYNFNIKGVSLDIDIDNKIISATAPKKNPFKLSFKASKSNKTAVPEETRQKAEKEETHKIRDILFALTPEFKHVPLVTEALKLLSKTTSLLPFDPKTFITELKSSEVSRRREIVNNLIKGYEIRSDGYLISIPPIDKKFLSMIESLHERELVAGVKVLVFPTVKINGNTLNWGNFLKPDASYPSRTVKLLSDQKILCLPKIYHETGRDQDMLDASKDAEKAFFGWTAISIHNKFDYGENYCGGPRTLPPTHCLTALALGNLGIFKQFNPVSVLDETNNEQIIYFPAHSENRQGDLFLRFIQNHGSGFISFYNENHQPHPGATLKKTLDTLSTPQDGAKIGFTITLGDNYD